MLDGKRIHHLCHLLTTHCDQLALERAVMLQFNQRIDYYATGASLPEIVFRLVVALENRLLELVAGIKIIQPNPALHAALDDLFAPLPGIALHGRPAYETLLVCAEPPEAFIDRTSLRRLLADVSRPDSGYYALSLHGSPASGKTFSWQLIQAVAREQAAHAVFIDVGETGVLDDRQLHDVCENIALALGLDGDAMRRQVLADNPTPPRIATKFAMWLENASRQAGRRIWLGLDGLNTATAPATVTGLLIPHILKRAAVNTLPELFLILFGYDARVVRETRRRVLHEQVEGLSPIDIDRFVRECATRRQTQLDDTEVAELVHRITDGLTWPYDHDAMTTISHKAGEVAKEVMR
jgi:hypothetical protein